VLRTVPVPVEDIFGREGFYLHQDHEVPVAVLATGCFGFQVAASLPSASLRVSWPHKYPGASKGITWCPNKTMSQPKQHPFAMTLRLQHEMAAEVEDIAYTLNLSRAAFIRRSIRRAIEQARQHELPLLKNKQVLEAIRP
jgi:hypothetical protein